MLRLRPSTRIKAVIVVSLVSCASRASAQPVSGGNLTGLRGVLRTVAASSQPPGTIGVGTDIQFFTADGLVTQGRDHSRWVNSYSIAWTVWSFLETALAMHVISDNSSTGAPGEDELQVAVGDPQLTVKGGYEILDGLSLGGFVDVVFPSGVGFFAASPSATTATFAAAGSYQPVATLPLMVHLNLGFILDGSSNLFENPQRLTPTQRFAAQLSSFNRVPVRVAVEYATRYVGPFVEYGLEPFVGSDAPGIGDSPSILSLGARAWLGEKRSFQLLAAFDIGLTGVGDGQPRGLPAGKYAFVIPRWNFVMRLSYRFNPFGGSSGNEGAAGKAGRSPGTAAKPPGSPITGRVIDARSSRPIWNARVRLAGDNTSALAVSSDGRFRSFQLTPGKHTLIVTAPGYAERRTEVDVRSDGATETTIQLTSSDTARPGRLRGSVKSVRGHRIRRATILIPELDRTIKVGRDGRFSVELDAGSYEVVVSARGFRAQRKRIRLQEGETVILNVELHR